MRSRIRTTLLTLFAVAAAGCRSGLRDWHELAEERGCTPELLATAAPYDSTRILELAGTYRLIRLDTVPRAFRNREEQMHEANVVTRLRLRVADSATANWERSMFDPKRMLPRRRPIVGVTIGADGPADTVHAEVRLPGGNFLKLMNFAGFNDAILFDGVEIERIGRWGFGGTFQEGGSIYYTDEHGNRLPYRAGIFCAIRE